MNNYPIPRAITEPEVPKKELTYGEMIPPWGTGNQSPHLVRVPRPPRIPAVDRREALNDSWMSSDSWGVDEAPANAIPPRPPLQGLWSFSLKNPSDKVKKCTVSFLDDIKEEGFLEFCNSLKIAGIIRLRRIVLELDRDSQLCPDISTYFRGGGENLIYLTQKDQWGNRCDHVVSGLTSPFDYLPNRIHVDIDCLAAPGFEVSMNLKPMTTAKISLYA